MMLELNFGTNLQSGLDEKEVQKRRKVFGLNKLDEKKKRNIMLKFIDQFKDFMIIILFFAAGISAIMSFFQKSNDYMDSVIIIIIVCFNALMGLIQENKAEKSLEALKKMSSPTAKVRRGGKICVIKGEELVPGDIVILESGNFVSADCRIIESYNLKIEESALTGETISVEKDTKTIPYKNIPIGDLINMAFSTTIIVNGHGTGIVTDIGMHTKVGKIASMIINDESPETPLQKKLSDVGKKLGIACLMICIMIFIIGSLKNISIIEMFMTSIGLAVAAIPEGLPAIVTIMLSIGVTKMAKKNAIIRKLPAVETLGSSTVICSDKTGTLTQNKMSVTKVYNINGKLENSVSNKDLKYILKLGSLCNDSIVDCKKGDFVVSGEATEVAIVNAGIKFGENKNMLDAEMTRINEIPFDSNRKMMTTIHKQGNKYIIITKGAPDTLIRRCNRYYSNGEIKVMDSSIMSKINKYNEEMASDALRVLAVSYSEVEMLPNKITSDVVENGLIFAGLIGMIDPPRNGVKEAVYTCTKAGIKTVMITGDHILTAKKVASEIGIFKAGDLAITGVELDKMSKLEINKNIMKYSVFARVSPEHKVRIVKAFRANRAVVAMTGDGVNDAPALKNADIGISMGVGGTDVAKSASDMILADDNFVTIVEAVKEGRHIYENIKKAVHFLLATNIGEIVTIFVGLLLGLDAPLLAIHLLWINLVTDSLPAIALGLEMPDKDIMKKKPKNSVRGLFSGGLWGKIFFEGIMIGLLTLVIFELGTSKFGLEVGRTMAFVSLSMLELVHSFNLRSDESIFNIGIFTNKYLVGAFVLGLILQVIVVITPPLASIFNVVPLNIVQWMYVCIISLAPVIIMEVKKKAKGLISTKVITFVQG